MAAVAVDTAHLLRWTASTDSPANANRSNFRLRIVNVDHYLDRPNERFDDLYSAFRQTETRRVPVIRVFGLTDNGVKTCLHVHRVYPYLSIRYESADDEDNREYHKQAFMSRLVREVEAKLVPTRVRTRNNTNANESANSHVIYDIKEVDAIPFYGFHDNYCKFLRIYLYNPWDVQKVSELLLSGQVMDRQLQPYEAHIPYTLQFLIDNNLYGMNFLEANRVEFRRTESMPDGIIYSDLEPMSSCQLECDIGFKDILNRTANTSDGRLPGLEAIWSEELRRCRDSQEVLKLKGVASQERHDLPATDMEEYHMKRLFDGLTKLNIKLDANGNNSPHMSGDTDFGQLSSDAISQTIEDVINNSQSISINQTIEDVIINSQNNTISQTIEDVISESQKQKKSSNVKHKKSNRSGHISSRKKLNFKNVLGEGPSRIAEPILSQPLSQWLDSDDQSPSATIYADATTQTEVADTLDDSMDSVFGSMDDSFDIICDCDSDECCDQCCDQGSDQCECDCDRCESEYEKCKRIPQLDGAFDSDDDSDGDKPFSPAYKDDSDDSDYDEGSKKKKKKAAPKKGAAKRGSKSTRSTPAKKSKTSFAVASDSDDDNYRSSPRRGRARTSTRRSPSPEPSDEDVFQSSSGRKVKASKNLSDDLWNKFKPKDTKKGRRDGSPMRMSFSDSDGEDKKKKGSGFLSSMDSFFKFSPTKNDRSRRSRSRSLTPYLDEEPDEEKPAKTKTKPGPRSSKASTPGPKSSKPGPKSSKASAAASRPGPKSSKSARPGPRSSKRAASVSSASDIEIISESPSTTRSRQSSTRAPMYQVAAKTSRPYQSIPKGKGRRSTNGKSELVSAVLSISEYITADDEEDRDLYESPKKHRSSTIDYLASATDLIWKSFNNELVQIDTKYYDMDVLDTIGRESLQLAKSPHYVVDIYRQTYLDNIDYWEEVKAEVAEEGRSPRAKAKAKPTPTRSKGALKDFYTLPHLNEKRSPAKRTERRSPSSSPEPPTPPRSKSKAKAAAKPKASPAPVRSAKAKSSASKGASNEMKRLLDDASHIIGKPLAKRGQAAKPKAKSKPAEPTRSARSQSSAKSKASGKSQASGRSSARQSTRVRVPRGVTTSTVFNAINIPFYESDIKQVTELTGTRKVAYLKGLCDSFDLDIQKLPRQFTTNYRRNRPDPAVWDNIYYNDYSGLLPDEQSCDTQDVLITMKNLVNSVVSVAQCVDSVVVNVINDIEPTPMIDTLQEAEFEEDWDYDPNSEEENDVAPESGITENGVEFEYPITAPEAEEESAIEPNSDPLSKALMHTFGDNEFAEKNEEQVNGDDIHGEEQNEVQSNDDRQSDDEEQARSDREDTNGYNSEPNEDEGRHGYEMPTHQYSPVAQSDQYSGHSKQYSTGQHSPGYQQTSGFYQEQTISYNRGPAEDEEDEEEGAGDGEDDDQTDENSNSSASNHMIQTAVHHQQQQQQQPQQQPFKMQDCLYGTADPNPVIPPQMGYTANILQNPIVPALPMQMPMTMPHHPNFGQPAQPQHFPAGQQWTQQQMYANNMAAAQPPAAQPDSDYDYNYMNYFNNNSNIPQFDGIFDDDDDLQTVGNPFNMRCTSDETIRQLSQGSRSEEATPRRHAADLVKEALLAGAGPSARPVVAASDGSDGRSSHSASASSGGERYGYSISGVVVKLDQSLPEGCLRQLGREVVPLEPLADCPSNSQPLSPPIFTAEEQRLFLKTHLKGEHKFNYLQSLCNKSIEICLNRLTTNAITEPSVSSHSSVKEFIPNKNNKTLCIRNTASCAASSSALTTDQLPDEVPESPLNITEDIDEVPESPISERSDGIFSFYLDDSLSDYKDSQSSFHSSQRSDHSFNDSQPLCSPSVSPRAQHSTPMNTHKFKPFSQTLSSTQKKINLSATESPPNSSNMFSTSEPILFDEPIAGPSHGRQRPKRYYYRNDSLIEGPTQSGEFELSSVEATGAEADDDDQEYQYLTTMSVEIHVSTRAKLNPDPKTDAIQIIFYSIHWDCPPDPCRPAAKYTTGMLAVDPEIDTYEYSSSFNVVEHKRQRQSRHSVTAPDGVRCQYADDEIILLMNFVETVKRYDPDIIVGFKIDTLSWGYILERARVLNMDVLTPLSRINQPNFSRHSEQTDQKCQLTGRISLNMWTVVRKEVTLGQYSYENCHFHVLHERIPCFGFQTLTKFYANRLNLYERRRVVDYYLKRTVGSLRMLDKLDFVGRTSELARIMGIQFHEVYTRGTQFRVESIMLRHCRPLDYIPISPARAQVAGQKAPEILPLILEPESKYFTDPVVVLDFQSLYPSMMIAYNYCYSTCLGRVDQLIRDGSTIDLGCFTLEMSRQLLAKHWNDIHISPNGVVFLKSNVRKGILPKMLEELLETRVMVKTAMKTNNKSEVPNKALNRKLDARQLGLKLIANVTYGYTSANFSGRMPCVDIADAIVAKGRETLERAINLVNGRREEWGGRVVYGDTDSLFIQFPGLSKEEAFVRGQEIAEVITQENPKPVRLKFEKVYLPCVLETKKRYVGFMWESSDQQNPVFDAKGIETVRRDTCPAVAKMLEKSLRILFKTNELNNVKEYLNRQFQKILNGRISLIEDFVFAREYRGAESYSERSHVPSAEIAKRRLAVDPRSEPKVKERVPYVVTAGAPNDPVFKLVKEPLDLIGDPSLRLNSQYYIERVIIPALNRVFQLMGQNVNDWYREMPKKVRLNRYQYLLGRRSKTERKTITHYFNTTECCVCEDNSKGKDFCDKCRPHKSQCAAAVGDQVRDIHLKYGEVLDACRKCSASRGPDIECLSIECPNLFRLHQSRLDLMNAKYLKEVMDKHF